MHIFVRQKQYHFFSWSIALVFALVLGFGDTLSGFWFIDMELDNTGVCWIESSSVTFNYRSWVSDVCVCGCA